MEVKSLLLQVLIVSPLADHSTLLSYELRLVWMNAKT